MNDQASKSIRAPKAVRQRLRKAAVAKVRQDIIHAGRSENDYSEEDLEYLVAEKEKEINLKSNSFGIYYTVSAMRRRVQDQEDQKWGTYDQAISLLMMKGR